MKICVVGTGSIGRRHILNLRRLAPGCELHVWRHGKNELPEAVAGLIDRTCYAPELPSGPYDAIVIADPTAAHAETIRALSELSQHFFIEKPLVARPGEDLSCLAGKAVQVACPLRYTTVYRETKRALAEAVRLGDRVIAASALCSSYLPEWRSDRDYRGTYSARRDLGGGVELDLIHEWDYLVDLFGFPQRALVKSARLSALELSAPDLSLAWAFYPDKWVEVHLDYFGRLPRRRLTLYLNDDTLECDFLQGTLTSRAGYRDCQDAENADYLLEMTDFLALTRGEKPRDDRALERAQKLVSLALGEYKAEEN